MTKSTITFSRKDSAKFFKTLNSRVNNYFKENKIKRSGQLETLDENDRYVFNFFSALFFDTYHRYARVATNFIYGCDGCWHGWSWNECDA